MGYTFDGPNKLIILTSGTTTLNVLDLWSRWVDWFVISDNSKYLPAFVQVGGNDIDVVEGTSIPIYAFLSNGWRVRPQEANHMLKVTNGIILVAEGGDPFVNTTGSYVVRINYQQPVQAITVSTGGGSAPTAQEVATAVWSDTVTDYSAVSGSFGQYVGKRLLSVVKFLGLK